MFFIVTFNDNSTSVVEAPDKEIAQAWAREDAEDKGLRVKSVRQATEAVSEKAKLVAVRG